MSRILCTFLLAIGTGAVASVADVGDNFRYSADVSSRFVKMGESDPMQLAFVGVDLHKIFSSTRRDLVTFTLQPYVAFVRNGPAGWDKPPRKHPIFDGSSDWGMQWRVFNANFKLMQNGLLNLRLGHIEVPFGIEHIIPTNGTALNYAHQANWVGIKADWGASLNGVWRGYEYEVAALRGSGNRYASEALTGESPFFVSGRFGSDRSADFVWGLSLLNGTLLTPSDGAVERTRYALDLQYYYGAFGAIGEFALGTGFGGPPANDSDVRQFIAEFNWRTPRETVLAWVQVVDRSVDKSTSRAALIGAEWLLLRRVTASAQLTRHMEPITSNDFLLQLRYRY